MAKLYADCPFKQDRARMLSQSQEGGWEWLQALPCERALYLSNEHMRYALLRYLGSRRAIMQDINRKRLCKPPDPPPDPSASRAPSVTPPRAKTTTSAILSQLIMETDDGSVLTEGLMEEAQHAYFCSEGIGRSQSIASHDHMCKQVAAMGNDCGLVTNVLRGQLNDQGGPDVFFISLGGKFSVEVAIIGPGQATCNVLCAGSRKTLVCRHIA
jgi:hypothetical protein